MKQDLNNMKGRIAAAKKAEWRKFLADRWHLHVLDDLMQTDGDLCPICSAP